METNKKSFRVNKKKVMLFIAIIMLLLCCWFNADYMKNNNVKILGEAEYVTNEVALEEDYFAQNRMEIEKARDLQISHLKQLLEDENIDAKTKGDVSTTFLQLIKSIEQEKICEQQIKNKIKYDVLVTVSPPQISVTVHAEELLSEEVARIKEIVLTQTGFASECIKISVTD